MIKRLLTGYYKMVNFIRNAKVELSLLNRDLHHLLNGKPTGQCCLASESPCPWCLRNIHKAQQEFLNKHRKRRTTDGRLH